MPKSLHQESFLQNHTILAMFFQSSRIRKVTTDFLDGKHMKSRVNFNYVMTLLVKEHPLKK